MHCTSLEGGLLYFVVAAAFLTCTCAGVCVLPGIDLTELL